jgi:lysophospholipase L1-like esterase
MCIFFASGCGTATDVVATTMFVGDSITQLWDGTSSGQANAFLFYDWVDEGVGGSTSGQILAELETHLTKGVLAVHILAGTNDVYPGWQLSVTSQNIEEMVSIARRNHSCVVLGTIPPWGPGSVADQADSSEERFDRISELNAWITAYGAVNAIPVIDYHAALVAANGQNYANGLSADGVHPNAAGFAIMTPLAEATLGMLLSASKC